ncbi:hypothetical protein EYC84_007829 [Monilinia fructicola]|uniref:Uncharacterized protein n=1 Tax=Monilinia fructicola TaxID=38448 RepID=A0A5M9JLI0_MONFR|nr:hypothetical protein EYC84_007829 [Monilinia fructicola]
MSTVNNVLEQSIQGDSHLLGFDKSQCYKYIKVAGIISGSRNSATCYFNIVGLIRVRRKRIREEGYIGTTFIGSQGRMPFHPLFFMTFGYLLLPRCSRCPVLYRINSPIAPNKKEMPERHKPTVVELVDKSSALVLYLNHSS